MGLAFGFTIFGCEYGIFSVLTFFLYKKQKRLHKG